MRRRRRKFPRKSFKEEKEEFKRFHFENKIDKIQLDFQWLFQARAFEMYLRSLENCK